MPSASPREAGSDSAESTRILEFLGKPSSYPESTRKVARIDTHISAVFLTDRFAYKLKKRVDFGFVDFSTLPLRQAACEQEVRLNRRLAPDVYLGLTPITTSAAGLELNGDGPVVDVLVKMQRLSAADALDAKIAAGEINATQIDQLCSALFAFYERSAPLTIKQREYVRHVEDHVLDNWETLEIGAKLRRDSAAAATIRRVHAAQLRLLRIAPDMFAERVTGKHVVDGHGDLRPEHIYFTPHPIIIDCIEFNDEFRQMDVLDELAFLSEECESLGAGWIGDRILARYRERCDDPYPPVLLEFYKSYRACVRAKVAAFRANQVAAPQRDSLDDETARYLALAERHSRRIGKPLVIVVYGLSGVGKSTLAQHLSQQLRATVLSTDHIRRTMFGEPEQATAAPTRWEMYRLDERLRVYGELVSRAGELLAERESVILDGTFASAEMRRAVEELAASQQATLLFVECECDRETALYRINARAAAGDSESDATSNVYLRQQDHFESADPQLPHCRVNTGEGEYPAAVAAVFQELRSRVPWSS